MKKLLFTLSVLAFISKVQSQEFPIATGNDTTFAISASFDGTNYLVPILGDAVANDNATVQFISPIGKLVGSRILVATNVGSMGILSAFDGTNYLLAWQSKDNKIIGQFLSKSGTLVGSQITIGAVASDLDELAFNDGEYLICYSERYSNDNGELFGQRMGTDGNLIGNRFSVESKRVGDVSVSYNGNKYLIAYTHRYFTTTAEQDLAFRFVSKTGELLGGEITVASGKFRRDNPTSLAFDGTKYLLTYHEQDTSAHVWYLYGRFIDTTGNFQNRFTICDSTLHPFLPRTSYGDDKYLITWTQLKTGTLMGQWYSKDGSTIGPPTVIMNSLSNKVPIGSNIYANNTFLIVATRLNNEFSDGDVYGKFIGESTSINEINTTENIQLYPNPAHDIIHVKRTTEEALEVRIYNISGIWVKTLTLINDQLQINISDLNRGIYFVVIQTKEKTERFKLVIEK